MSGLLSYAARINRDVVIIRRYRSGETLRRIGQSLRLSHERIRQILTEQGIPIRGRGYRSPEPTQSRASLPLRAEPAGTPAPVSAGTHPTPPADAAGDGSGRG